MDYWVLGDEAKSKQYEASFAALGFDVSHMSFSFKNWVYYTHNGIIHACCNDTLPSILEDHPRYQKIPLIDWEYSPLYNIGEIVVTGGLFGRVNDTRNENGVFEYKVGDKWFTGNELRAATKYDLNSLTEKRLTGWMRK